MSVLKKTVLFVFTLAFMGLSSCNKDEEMNDTSSIQTQGEGDKTKQILSLSKFNGIDLSIAAKIIISQGSKQEIKAIGDPYIIKNLKTIVSNNIWEIALEEGVYEDYELTIEIIIPDIKYVELSSSGNITLNNFSNQEALKILSDGSGNLILNEFNGITELEVILYGSGNLNFKKNITTLNTLNINSSGSGDYSGFKLNSKTCNINSSASGKSEVSVINSLNASISGSGNILYQGKPKIKQSINGSGNLIDAN